MRAYQPVKLSDYCEITSSKRIYAKEYIDSGVPFYRGKEIVASFSGGEVSDPLFISENRFEEIKHRFGAPEKGDLLLTSVGTIGVPYRVTGEFDFYFKDGNLTWFRKLNGVDQNFLYYWLQSPQGKAELSKCTIGAAQPAYTIERLKEISIELPPESIQRDIASVIADYDIALKNNRRRIQLLEESARLLYQEWFVYLRFPGYEQVKITDGVPEGWARLTVAECCEKPTYGYTASAMQDAIGPKFLRITDIVPSSIGWPDVPYCEADEVTTRKYLLAEGDIVVARTGATVGYAKRMPSLSEPVVYASYLVKFTPNNSVVDDLLLGIFMESEQYKEFVRGNAGGAAQPNANAQILGAAKLLVPTELLQKEFRANVAPLLEQKFLLEKQNFSLSKARDLLLPKLMSGELTV